MRRFALAALLLMAMPVSAGEWATLTGDEIRAALTDRKLQYRNAWQEFRASGRTLYNAGEDSWGYWRVEDDRYCSMWPPSDLWACYALERNGDSLRFVGERDDIADAVYAD